MVLPVIFFLAYRMLMGLYYERSTVLIILFIEIRFSTLKVVSYYFELVIHVYCVKVLYPQYVLPKGLLTLTRGTI